MAKGRESFSEIKTLNGMIIKSEKKIPVTAPAQPIIAASEKTIFTSVPWLAPRTRKTANSLSQSSNIREKTTAKDAKEITRTRTEIAFIKIRIAENFFIRFEIIFSF